ncbi:MAG: dihydroneopterin aldolase [Alphaproteobacteria bacterium]|nr:dihydroneopterin aldolase [Alphaproteobacteria bacterium]
MDTQITHITVKLKNHRFYMLIGIDDSEKITPQEVIINAELDVECKLENLKADNIGDVYNYVALKNDIEAIANKGHIGLIENFAEQIADCALTNAMVKRCRIYIQKPDVFSNLDSVGVELTKERV